VLLSGTETIESPRPEIIIEELTEGYGKFVIGPLERGYGLTVGNPLRRVLLNSIPGTAVTWVKIDGATHEYTTVPHIKEDVPDLLLNFKAIRLKSIAERPGKLRLEVSGEGLVTAADILVSADYEIMNPELNLATLDSPEASLVVEFNVEQGTGYVPAGSDEGFPIGVLPVDAIFTPVLKVNYRVERTRVGQVTDYERLVLEVWTDETIGPMEAVSIAGQVLTNQFFLFTNVGKITETSGEKSTLALSLPPEIYNTPVERLELSARTFNCLKRAHIDMVGEVLEKEESELLQIRNFGEKSLRELNTKLHEMGFVTEETIEQTDLEAENMDVPASGQEDEMASSDERLEASE